MKSIIKKLFSVLVVVFMATTLFAGCATQQTDVSGQTSVAQASETEENSAAPPAEGEKKKIGLSLFSLSAEYLAALKDNMIDYQKTQGLDKTVELIVLDAENDASKQLSQVDNLISQKVDAVIIAPLDREQLVPAIKACKEAKIPCIELAASTVAVEERTSYVGSDDIVSGRMLMEALAEKMGGKGNLVILHGITGVNAEVMRHTGAQEILEKYPEITIVSEQVCDWDRAKAMSTVENLLQTGMGIDAIFAENDEMAMGALNAVQGSGKEKNIIIGGVDAIPDALQSVMDGGLYCTIFQNNKSQAEKALELAVKVANGEEIEKEYMIPYELVTIENAKDYVGK